ncbi:hypothetical protein CC85DRAFT_289187 [Cutaneotrichosporon oleaginosum]|uniref:Uncharacterized protein n=1 Tax=Cutaneotrichosporon oleaginosum TaxID=879819 RepID=A0A0J0XCI3_9TREE|nr:uncharacterized protein CC85DRAFT_289187 [Cutaneotrichosporon oleaginosum]KLT38780.1 hypothetical protein CC85DRAFT_289187 [Cutaneotrichosporon oleaginosum]TXT09939.1 hypothetical protein COLE_03873 [Cutaneotrichosporon oleaginosum]
MRTFGAARSVLAPRPQCWLPCFPVCRQASTSAASNVAFIHSEPQLSTLLRPQDTSRAQISCEPVRERRSRSRGSHAPRNPDPPPIAASISASSSSSTPAPRRIKSLDAALDSLPPAVVARPPHTGRNGLAYLLRLPATTSSLGRLLPAVTCSIEPSVTAYDRRLRALGWYAQAAQRAHALTFIRPVVDEGLRVLTAISDLERRRSDIVDRTISRYHRFLRALAGGSNASALPNALQEELGRVVGVLTSSLESMTPPANLAVRPASFNALLSPRFLVPATLAPVLAHVNNTRIALSSSQWLAVATVSLASGRQQDALNALAQSAGGGSSASHRLMAAEGAASLAEAVELLQPIVASMPVDTDSNIDGARPQAAAAADAVQEGMDLDTSRRAWSILLSRAANNDGVSAKQLSALAAQIPDAMIVGHTITPVMHGLVRRGDLVAARRIWRDLQNSYQAATDSGMRAALIDAAALSVGAEVQFARPDGLVHALKAVDFYAWRPQQGHKVESPRPAGGRAVRLDTQSLNLLISLASRDGKPGVAFRLWEAARDRWGVIHDDITLTNLIECARTCVESGFDPGMDTLRGRLRALASALHSAPTYQKKEVDWRVVPLKALLDPPRYSWHEEYGGQQPWARARALFRAVVLGNWPGLEQVPSPLGARTFLGIADLIAPRAFPAPSTYPAPASGAVYAHVIPSAKTWEAYMSLLRQYGAEFGDAAAAEDEVARALGWMRALGIRPTWRTALEALMHVGEQEGARRRVRINNRTVLARDEEILRAWLAEWIPAVPSESDVADYRRQIFR